MDRRPKIGSHIDIARKAINKKRLKMHQIEQAQSTCDLFIQ
jgi:hypothetical protein